MNNKKFENAPYCCGHSYVEHIRMEEAKSSAELEGATTNKTICELLKSL